MWRLDLSPPSHPQPTVTPRLATPGQIFNPDPICHLSDLPGALLRREPYWSSSEADSSSSEEEFLDEINYPQQELLVYQDVVHIIPPPVALLDTLSICWDSQSCEYAHSLHDQLCHASWLLLRARFMILSNARLVRE